MCCTCRGAARATQPRGQPLLPRQGRIWENICSDKESASPGRGQARAHQLLQRTENGLLRGGAAGSPAAPRTQQGPDTGFNGLETNRGSEWGRISDDPGPKQETFRAQRQTSGWPRHPTAPAVPTASATGTRCRPRGQQGLPRPCLRPPAPHDRRQHQAGLETCVCSGKERGRENWGGGLVHARHRATRIKAAHRFPRPGQRNAPHGCCKPTSNRYEPGSGGARSARQREGDWAGAARRQRAEADAPSGSMLPGSSPARLWPGATCGEPSRDMHAQAGAGSGPLSRSRGLKQHASRLWAAMTIMRQILSSCEQPSA